MKKRDFWTMTKQEQELDALRVVEKLGREQIETSNRFPGYHYIRVTVEDIDGGVPQPFYTHCKPKDFPALLTRIHKAAKWPIDLVRDLPVLTVKFDNNAEVVLKRSTVIRKGKGGRKPQDGISQKTAAKYDGILDSLATYQKAGYTDRQFSSLTKTPWATLAAAKLYRAGKIKVRKK